MANVIPSKAPNLINAPEVHSKSYTDNLNNILRLYFNTLDGNNAYILNTLVDIQAQIDLVLARERADRITLWLSVTDGIWAGH